MATKREFTILESYKHKFAKAALMEWLQPEFTVKDEVPFTVDGWKFIVDVVSYTDGFVQAFYEIVNSHPLDGRKLGRMQHYCYNNDLNIICHEVDAEWILRQVKKPESLVEFAFDLNTDENGK